MRTITLVEYQPLLVPVAQLSPAEVAVIGERYGSQMLVEWPNQHHPNAWQLLAPGWVGQIPIADVLLLEIQPRVSVRSVFAMLEYAFDLQHFHLLDGLTEGATLAEMYDRLAEVLGRRTLDLVHQGLALEYHERRAPLPYVRGRIETRHLASPDDGHLVCVYGDLVADGDDNQILLAALWVIWRSPMRSEAARHAVHQAIHALRDHVTLVPVTAAHCQGRRYTRHNTAYRPLHALAALFLSASGPSLLPGAQPFLPSLVWMPQLFERYVARWLATHLPATYAVRAQEHVALDPEGRFTFRIDLVVAERQTGTPRWVLDTKYVPVQQPAAEDIAQILAYAHVERCTQAVLMYPQVPTVPLDTEINGIRVRSLAFALDQAPDVAGGAVLRALGAANGGGTSPPGIKIRGLTKGETPF